MQWILEKPILKRHITTGKLSTPCNGFLVQVQGETARADCFQLHVMDSGPPKTLCQIWYFLLSTPCNGFPIRPLNQSFHSGTLLFQLHVMDSGKLILCSHYKVYYISLSTPCNGFTMLTQVFPLKCEDYLSTPCNGFILERMHPLNILVIELSTPCNGFFECNCPHGQNRFNPCLSTPCNGFGGWVG